MKIKGVLVITLFRNLRTRPKVKLSYKGEKQMTQRLRTCCSLCGSLGIRRVKSLRIYRCSFCNQSFVTPSSKLVESYESFPKYLMISKEKINKS